MVTNDVMVTRKTVLITGANRGIGLEVARQLGENGFHILLSGRNPEHVDQASAALRRLEISVQGVVMDVSDPASIRSAAQSILSQIQTLDVLVNNAGILLDETTPLLSVSEGDFYRTFTTNAFSAFSTVQIFLPVLNKGSRIINVSSGSGQILNGITTWAPVYSMSKTLMNVITMQLAEALKEKHIAVNAVCPGWVRTEMGGRGATRSVHKGAETIVWLATEADGRISGKFFRNKKEIHW